MRRVWEEKWKVLAHGHTSLLLLRIANEQSQRLVIQRQLQMLADTCKLDSGSLEPFPTLQWKTVIFLMHYLWGWCKGSWGYTARNYSQTALTCKHIRITQTILFNLQERNHSNEEFLRKNSQDGISGSIEWPPTKWLHI